MAEETLQRSHHESNLTLGAAEGIERAYREALKPLYRT